MVVQFQRAFLTIFASITVALALAQPIWALAQPAAPASSSGSPASSLLQLLQGYVVGETTKQKFLEDFGFKPDTSLFVTIDKVTQNGWVIMGTGMEISSETATNKVTGSSANIDVGVPKKYIARLIFTADKLTRIEYK